MIGKFDDAVRYFDKHTMVGALTSRFEDLVRNAAGGLEKEFDNLGVEVGQAYYENRVARMCERFSKSAMVYGAFIEQKLGINYEPIENVHKERLAYTGKGEESYLMLESVAFEYEFSFLENLEQIEQMVGEIVDGDPNFVLPKVKQAGAEPLFLVVDEEGDCLSRLKP